MRQLATFDTPREEGRWATGRADARFVQLTPELLDLIELRKEDHEIARQLESPSLVVVVTAPGRSIALLEGDRVIGAGGVLPQWEGRALAWLLAGRYATRAHFALAARFARTWLDQLQADRRFARVDASTPAASLGHCHFLERLGFEREGVMRRYGLDGADHALYARVASSGATEAI